MKIKFTLFLTLLSAYFIAQGQTTIDKTIQHGGLTREYKLYIPAAYNSSQAVPLLFNLHGYTSINGQQIFYGEFRPIADTANFIMVLPNGTFDNTNNRFWNAWGLPQPDDIGFISALIDTISAAYNIDANRVYSTGMSNGGIMSYTLACSLSNRIAAIASVTGTMTANTLTNCSPGRPVPVMEIHGTADATVPYTGGGALNFEDIDSLMSYWVNNNNCNPTPTFNAVPDIVTTDLCTAEHYVWGGGNMGSSVELYKIIGGGHTWPNAIINLSVTNMDFNASNEIWRFFNKYSLNMFTTSINEAAANKGFTIYPNPSVNNFTLRFDTNGKKAITITNTMGQLVKQLSFTGTQTEIAIDAPGLYFISVNDGDKVFSQKVIRY